MAQLRRSLSILLLFLFFVVGIGYGQTWKKDLSQKSDSVFAVYSWEVHDEAHGVGGDIILKKNGRYKYNYYRPLAYEEFSEGNYKIDRNIITLNSDLQYDNVKVSIEYVDTVATSSLYQRLDIPTNNKGELIFNCYYVLNNESTRNTLFDPAFEINRHLLDSLTSIKLGFWDADFGSAWIPILEPKKIINVKILTDDNYTRYKPRVFNRSFKMRNNQLIEIKGP